MNTSNIEILLERIAIALESLVRIQTHGNDVGINTNDPSTTRESAEGAAVAEKTSVATPPLILEPFLATRGIAIKVLAAEDAADQVIDSLSLFLGERYEALSGVLTKIKRAMQTGAPITESLKGTPQLDISSVCQFCTRLSELAFLEQYQYQRSPIYLIRAKTTTLPKAQRFFGGQWLERFILQKVKTVHDQIAAESEGLPFEYLINPQIVLPNGDDFELDILAAFGPHIVWIEAKSGDYQQHVAKYAKFARLIGLNHDHALMVLADAPAERCDALSSLFSMTVCNLHNFEGKLLSVVQNDMARPSGMK